MTIAALLLLLSAADAGDDLILVSATRAPVPVDEVPASATVLDKPAIDRAQDIAVSDLLLRTPGITLSRSGGFGGTTALRIRGAETDQTVVIVDGVKLNDPGSTGGGYNFADLLVGDTARIEILRGPQSILWGSQAIGGVVNIVTAAPEKSLEANYALEGGARDTFSARAAIGGKSGPVSWRIGGQAFRTDGISAISPKFGGRERDGYTNRTLTGRVNIAIAEGLSADLRGFYIRGRNDFDGTTADSPAYGINRQLLGYAGLNLDLMQGRFRNRIAYGYTDTNRDNFDPRNARTKTFDAAGTNRRIEYQGNLALTDRIDAQFGAEHEQSRFRSVTIPGSLSRPIPAPSRGSAEIDSLYLQLSVRPVSGLTLNGGLRYDHHDRFGGSTLVALGGVWALPSGTILRANYGEGFKAPSLYQLYSENGNPDLTSEQAHGWEAGVEQRLLDHRLTFGIAYYRRTTRDQIVFIGCGTSSNPLCAAPLNPPSRVGFYQNVSRAQAKGVEAQVAFRPTDRLILDANYSWTAAEDRSAGSATFGNWLPRRPRRSGNASASYEWPFGLTTGAALRWAGHSFDNAANTQRLDGYTLVDLRAELRLAKGVAAFARIENLLNERYMTAYRYGTLGRGVYAGLRGRL